MKNIPADAKLDETKKKDNPWDLYVDSWAADWPSGASILPVLYDGRTIKAEGNSNSSFFNDAAINAEFDRVLALTRGRAGRRVGQARPADHERATRRRCRCTSTWPYNLHGSKAGGAVHLQRLRLPVVRQRLCRAVSGPGCGRRRW